MLEKGYYPVTKDREESKDKLKFLSRVQHKRKEDRKNNEDVLDENFIGRYSKQKYDSNVILLLNGCVADAEYCGLTKQLKVYIYNEENSLDKINEAKSLLEKKTGWTLDEIK
jgi:hypothetical protein